MTGHHGGAFKRAVQTYLDALNDSGFAVVAEPVRADEKTMRAKPGLKLPRDTPLALVFDCHAI